MKIQRFSGRLLMATLLVSSVMLGTGCTPKQTEPTMKEQPAPVPMQRGVYRPNAGAGMAVSQLAFPTGDAATSAVLLSTVTPAEVRAGQAYNYQLHVTNLSNVALQNVNLTSTNASNLEVTASRPEAARSAGGFNWNLGNIPGGETRIVEVTGRADQVGNSAACFAVSYNNLLCTTVRVTQPALAVTKSAPAEVMICDPIPMVFEVRNTGSGKASGVRLTDTLPSGLTTVDGQQVVNADVGDLGPGEAKRVTVQAKAARTGTYNNTGSVAAAGNLTAQSNTTTTIVRQPVLVIACQAPERIYLGRDASFSFTVRNTGDAASANTTLNLPLPAGTTFVSATEGGTASATGAAWNLGTIPAGGSKTASLTVRPSGIAQLSTSATVQGVCAAPVSTTCSTSVQGIPAILLEMVDDPDPVLVGDTTTYRIRVTNQGSAVGTGIKVTLELPPEIDYVSQTGVTNGTLSANGRTIQFAVLPSLQAKSVAEWKVVVKANAPKDIRTKATVISDQFSVPLEKLESTNLYR